MVVSWQAINDGGDFDIGKHKIGLTAGQRGLRHALVQTALRVRSCRQTDEAQGRKASKIR